MQAPITQPQEIAGFVYSANGAVADVFIAAVFGAAGCYFDACVLLLAFVPGPMFERRVRPDFQMLASQSLYQAAVVRFVAIATAILINRDLAGASWHRDAREGDALTSRISA